MSVCVVCKAPYCSPHEIIKNVSCKKPDTVQYVPIVRPIHALVQYVVSCMVLYKYSTVPIASTYLYIPSGSTVVL